MLESHILNEKIGEEKIKQMMFDNFNDYLKNRGWKLVKSDKDCEETKFLKGDLKIIVKGNEAVYLHAAIGEDYFKIGIVTSYVNSTTDLKSSQFLNIINNY